MGGSITGKAPLDSRHIRAFLFNKRVPRLLYRFVLPLLAGFVGAEIAKTENLNIGLFLVGFVLFTIGFIVLLHGLEESMSSSLVAPGDTVVCHALPLPGLEGDGDEMYVGVLCLPEEPVRGGRVLCVKTKDGRIGLTSKPLVKLILPDGNDDGIDLG